jgi:hypothetical protein
VGSFFTFVRRIIIDPLTLFLTVKSADGLILTNNQT